VDVTSGPDRSDGWAAGWVLGRPHSVEHLPH